MTILWLIAYLVASLFGDPSLQTDPINVWTATFLVSLAWSIEGSVGRAAASLRKP